MKTVPTEIPFQNYYADSKKNLENYVTRICGKKLNNYYIVTKNLETKYTNQFITEVHISLRKSTLEEVHKIESNLSLYKDINLYIIDFIIAVENVENTYREMKI